MTFNETRTRWDHFLQKIEDRFKEVLETAKDALPILLEATDIEIITFQNAWSGIYENASQLITKIENTWQEKVEETFLDLGLDEDSSQFIQELNKGLQLQFKLEQELKSYEVSIFHDAAQKLLLHVKEVLSRDFCCTQCQAKLLVKEHFFRSYYCACEYCQTVNTFEPGTKARYIEHFAINSLGEKAALKHFLKYEAYKFQNYIKNKKVYKKKDLTAQYKKYVETYLKKRIEIIPDYKDRYEKDFEAKMALLN